MATDYKHTPGPWALGKYGAIIGGPFQEYANGRAQSQLALATLGNGIYDAEREANARLIAAAPELLEALKDAVKDCACSIAERDSGHLIECFAPAALGVIAKAEGK